jgi:hypothetical protein
MALQDYNNTNDAAAGTTVFDGVSSDSLASQSFTPNQPYTIESITLWLRRLGTVGNATVSIRANTGSPPNEKPTGSDLCSGIADVSGIPTGSTTQVSFTISSPIVLSVGVVYNIVLISDGTNSSNGVNWRRNSSEQYANRNRCDSPNGTTWTARTNDHLFETYGTAATEDFDEGTIAVVGTGVVVLSIETFSALNYDEGVIAVSISAIVTLKVEVFNLPFVWVQDRPVTYDPVLTWDPDTQSWIAQTEAELKYILVAVGHDVNGLGTIYFNEV